MTSEPLWQWICWFRKSQWLKQLFLHGDGVEVDREDLNLLGFLLDVSEVLKTMQATNDNVEDWSYNWRSLCT